MLQSREGQRGPGGQQGGLLPSGLLSPVRLSRGTRPAMGWLILLHVASAHALAVQPQLCRTRSAARSLGPLMQVSLREDADKAVAQRGAVERSLLQPGTPLVALKQKRAVSSSAGGFGGGKPAATKAKKGAKKAKAPSKAPSRSVLAQELEKNGVVRIDGALSKETTAALRDFCDSEREAADRDVAAGKYDRTSRFADLVLLENRCDLLMPLRGPCVDALHELLGPGSVLGGLLTEVVGDDGVLQEIACLFSDPGSEQQPLHPDTPWTPVPPLYAAFVAMQDIEIEMGPTYYLPGTHTKQTHTEFYGGDLERGRDMSGVRTPPICEDFLRSREVRYGLLKAGDLALYNQQVLHCGSANESQDKRRRQFYISFRDLKAGPVKARASIRPAFKEALSLGEIKEELSGLKRAEKHGAGGDGFASRFAELDRIDTTEDAKERDRHQAGSLYLSLEGGPLDLV